MASRPAVEARERPSQPTGRPGSGHETRAIQHWGAIELSIGTVRYTKLAPRGSVQGLLEQNAGHFWSSTLPALRYFNTSHFEISWYFDTEMPIFSIPKSKIAKINLKPSRRNGFTR